jgi:hypothetical protein
MTRLQLVGPIVLFGVVFAAEAAAYALTLAPSSTLLWYLNLEVFGIFRKSRASLSAFCSLPFAQILIVAGPMALIGMAGLMLRNNLCIAISSNIAFVYATYLAHSWSTWHTSAHMTASHMSVHVPAGNALYLCLMLGIASFASFVISHIAYLGAIRSKA